MGPLHRKVIDTLRSHLARDIVDGLETIPSTGRVTGWVASDAFNGEDDRARQAGLWKVLENHLKPEELKQLGPIVTLNLEEAKFDVSLDS